jgi:hypothetical protein
MQCGYDKRYRGCQQDQKFADVSQVVCFPPEKDGCLAENHVQHVQSEKNGEKGHCDPLTPGKTGVALFVRHQVRSPLVELRGGTDETHPPIMVLSVSQTGYRLSVITRPGIVLKSPVNMLFIQRATAMAMKLQVYDLV